MNTLKKLALVFMSFGIMLTGCGRTAEGDDSMPDGIVEIAPTTQSWEEDFDRDEFDYDEPYVTTTYFYEPEIQTATTTTVRRGPVYVASARPKPPTIHTATTMLVTTSPPRTNTTAPSPGRTTTTRVSGGRPTQTTASAAAAAKTTSSTTAATTTTTTTTAIQTTSSADSTTVTTTAYAGISPEEQLSKLTLRQKAAQMFIASPDQLAGLKNATEANTTMKRTIEDIPVGGVIFGEDNLVSKKQLSALLLNMSGYFEKSCGVGTMISVCEEGGEASPVSRKLLTTSFYEPPVYGNENDPEHVCDIGKTMGQELLKLGFRLNLAPPADITKKGYSSDENIAAELVKSMIRGLKDSGVYSAAGNFPGTEERSGRILKQLRAVEFVPYKAAIEEGVSFITMGHQRVSGFGDSLPADLSPKAVGCLRDELGFAGVIISGNMSDEAVTEKYSSGEAAVASVKAGVDMVLLPADLKEAVDALCKAVEDGDIPEERIDESVLRILTVKKSMGLY